MTCPGMSWDILGFRKTQDIPGYPRICTYGHTHNKQHVRSRCVFFQMHFPGVSSPFHVGLKLGNPFFNLHSARPGRARPHVESNSRLKSNTRANKQKTGDDQKQFVGSEKRTS